MLATAPGVVSVQADTQHGFQASNQLADQKIRRVIGVRSCGYQGQVSHLAKPVALV